MAAVGNILWFLFFGWWNALVYILAGALWCVTVIGIPIGKALFQYAKLMALPFGKVIMKETEIKGAENVSAVRRVGGVIANIIWLPIGIILFVVTIVETVAAAITIIGIPVAVVLARSAKFIIWPIGAKVITKQQVETIRMEKSMMKVMGTAMAVNQMVGNPNMPQPSVQRAQPQPSARSMQQTPPLMQQGMQQTSQPSAQNVWKADAASQTSYRISAPANTQPAQPSGAAQETGQPAVIKKRFCSQCGAECPGQMKFCSKCGARVAQPSVQNAATGTNGGQAQSNQSAQYAYRGTAASGNGGTAKQENPLAFLTASYEGEAFPLKNLVSMRTLTSKGTTMNLIGMGGALLAFICVFLPFAKVSYAGTVTMLRLSNVFMALLAVASGLGVLILYGLRMEMAGFLVSLLNVCVFVHMWTCGAIVGRLHIGFYLCLPATIVMIIAPFVWDKIKNLLKKDVKR